MNRFVRSVLVVGALLLSVIVFSSDQVNAGQGCDITSYTATPEGDISLGTHKFLDGKSSCGTVRFEVNGAPRAEIGSTNQTETFKSEEFGTGLYEVCFVARGNGDWSGADRSCKSFHVYTNQTGTEACRVVQFSVSPGKAQVGSTLQFAGSSNQCSLRASRFYINGGAWGESSLGTNSATWNTSGQGAGWYEICFGVTAGDWSNQALSCVQVELTQVYVPPTPPAIPTSVPNNNGGSNPQPTPIPNNGGSNNPPPTTVPNNSGGQNTNCPTNLSRLAAGMTATVADVTPDPADMRSGAGRNYGVIVRVPIRHEVRITGSHRCADGWVWWPVSYNGQTGWIREVDSRRLYDLVPVTSSGNNGGSSNGSSAVCNSPAPVSVGSIAKVTDGGSANRVRSGAGTNYSELFRVQPGERFEVIGGPTCAGEYRWWQIRYNGNTGWMADGNQSENWIAYVSGGNNGGNVQQNIVDIPLVMDDGSEFTFRYNVDRKWILNGSEFAVSELAKVNERFSSAGSVEAKLRVLLLYASPVIGESDRNVRIVKDGICNGVQSCESRILYQVGDRVMDLSGIGNIVYGYYIDSLNLPLRLSDLVANWDQLLSSIRAKEYITIRDNPDDIMQREVGKELRKRGLSVRNLNDIANSLGLY